MKKIILALTALSFLSGCGKIVENAVKNNPEIVFNAIKEDPKGFMEAVNSTRDKMQEVAREEQAKKQSQEIDDAFENPQKPEIGDNRVLLGNEDAPITIVEYADFACHYCAMASSTISKVESEYGDKVRVLYKHFPVLGVPASVTASKMMEAMTHMDVKKAYKFNKTVFANQKKLRGDGAEDFLKSEAKKLFGASKVSEIMKKANSDKIAAVIESDTQEAGNKFGLRGTPAFNINGVFLKGAYPYEKFKEVIDRHLENMN